MMTKQELEDRKIELEIELNKIRNELFEQEANQKKKEYGDKYSCEFCKFNAVSGFSYDGWHNTCGKGECTCCHDVCDLYEPDNEITLFIKQNIRADSKLLKSKNTNGHGYLTEDEYHGLRELVGDIFYHENLTEKLKKVLTACFDTEKKQIEGEWVFDDYDES